jgi:hypothetical protein
MTQSGAEIRGVREVEELREQFLKNTTRASKLAHGMRFTAEPLHTGEVRFIADARRSGDWTLYAQKFFGGDAFTQTSSAEMLKGIFVGRL